MERCTGHIPQHVAELLYVSESVLTLIFIFAVNDLKRNHDLFLMAGRHIFVYDGKQWKCQAWWNNGCNIYVCVYHFLLNLIQCELCRSVNKNTKWVKGLIVLEKDVLNFFMSSATLPRSTAAGWEELGGVCVAEVLLVPGDGALLSHHWLHYSLFHIFIPQPF